MTDRRGGDTRTRIMDAAVETLHERGITGTTARAIAERGGFNQALIFYHFGSVTDLLLEAFARTSSRQVARYREAAGEVRTLQDLVEIARRLHREDLESGAVAAVIQLMAASVSEPAAGARILDGFGEWIALLEEVLERTLPDHPLREAVPTGSAAYAIAAMFLGIELMSRLDPDRSRADELFDLMRALAGVLEDVVRELPAPAERPSITRIEIE